MSVQSDAIHELRERLQVALSNIELAAKAIRRLEEQEEEEPEFQFQTLKG